MTRFHTYPRAMRLVVAVGIVFAIAAAWSQPANQGDRFIVESYPDPVVASKDTYLRQLSAASANVTTIPFYVIVPRSQRWAPGQTIRVAFNGGSAELYAKIQDAASTWITTGKANLVLQFKDASGKYFTWSPADASYAAEIRVAFASGQVGGYWSHVGTDSINSALYGGASNQASLNLDSFDRALPSDWKAIVMHEFGHALGFQHEHQNPQGGCDFRFDDDPGYVPTKDAAGWYKNDAAGRRPGLYTYLGGYANFWPRPKVDFNLRALSNTSAYTIGAFDKNSIMKYFFDQSMFIKGKSSPCYTPTENLSLSPQDVAGVQEAYPSDASAAADTSASLRDVLQQLRDAPDATPAVYQQTTKQLSFIK